ncbi:BTAD domain-containing putative transcriptional regulator [Streptomyces sp. 891-h]|uniref:AfsR/SARP family transcriptional regulator n=1 Tax=Streptomyces sp. 891-h TaxID=2720714 RepID=UPI001FA9B1CF|nr:BTAD domain-containing putative transcriptional regulator [Streptomyces sp. 891-h]UNZ18556.1 AfsR/SARP family transcriptional regulator [Streptomyces sp. 891-h]
MRYLILGASEARDEAGQPLPLGGQRLRALFAALALHARSRAPMPADALIEDVWADAEHGAMPENAPAALQALVARLRRALGKDAVESLHGGYRLRIDPERDEVDLIRFEHLAAEGERALEEGDPERAAAVLREGLALWRGPALADLPGRTPAAARAEALRHTVLQRRLTAELALGRAARVLPELRELAPAHPLDEPLQTLYLRALHDSGRTAEALAAYESVRRGIAARLGADPGPELRTLHAELLAAGVPEEDRSGGAGGAGRDGGAGGAELGAVSRDAVEGSAASPRAAAPGAGATPRTEAAPRARAASPASGAAPKGSRPTAARGRERVPGSADRDGRPKAGSAPAGRRGNLRARLTSFVGRETDIAAIDSDLGASRLVTLIGPGGSGKTRLAEQVAATAAATEPTPYPDGTWLVELAPLDHPAAVPDAVLSALGRRVTSLSTAATEGTRSLGGDGDATALLIEHLEQRDLLLVLDNCEHVVHAAATLAETLLAHCPGLTVLATSRERLGVPGETVRPVEPLPPVPAHRLFADRAAAARPGFRTSEDPEAVAEICRRLDGLPLAIELAAARLRSLTPRQIADRLDDRFRLLTSGSRTVLPRQQTLRAVVDWSWDLLDERERTVVRRLSVFAGGCTLSAAEHVCADGSPDGVEQPHTGDAPKTTRAPEAPHAPGTRPEPIRPDDVLDLLSALVDKSILVADQPPALSGTGVRYRMLETIHDYARERAAEHPADREAAGARHSAQILRFANAAEPRLRSAEQLSWLPRVEADLDNIRAALHRSLRDGDLETVVSLVRSAGWFWWLRNYRDEGAHWVKAVLSMLPPTRQERDWDQETLFREFQLLDYFLLAEHHSQELLTDPHHRAVAQELLITFREPGPDAARFPGLLWPFTSYLLEGNKGVASLMDVSVANCRRYGGPWELAVSLLFRAHVLLDLPGGVRAAKDDLPEIRALAESTGDRWLLSQLCGLRAEVALQEGRYDDARAECETALRYAQELGAFTEMPLLLARIAEIWFRRGDTEQADKLADRAMEQAEQLGVRDALTIAVFVRSVAATEADDIERARDFHSQAQKSAAVGTPPAMFEVMMRVLDARITASEGPELLPEAIRKIRTAIRTGLEVGIPESLVGQSLLTAGYILHLAGRHPLAVQFADAAQRLRGELPASVPERRLDGTIRAYSGPSGPSAAGPADPAGRPPLTGAEAVELLDELCAQFAAETSTEETAPVREG